MLRFYSILQWVSDAERVNLAVVLYADNGEQVGYWKVADFARAVQFTGIPAQRLERAADMVAEHLATRTRAEEMAGRPWSAVKPTAPLPIVLDTIDACRESLTFNFLSGSTPPHLRLRGTERLTGRTGADLLAGSRRRGLRRATVAQLEAARDVVLARRAAIRERLGR